MVDEPVGDAGLVGDVRHAAGVKALAGEHAHGGVEDHPALVDRGGRSALVALPAVGRGPAVASAGSRRRTSRSPRGRGRRRSRSRCPARAARTRPHGSTISERPPERRPPRMRADLVGRDHEALVLDRPRPQQHLPVVARRRERERGRHGDHLGAAHGEDPVQLGKAQVVADAHAEPRRRRPSSETTISSPGLLGAPTRAYVGAVDLDVEHVDLAVDGAQPAVGADVDAGVGALRRAVRPRSTIEPATQVDPELGGGRPRPRDRRARRAPGRPPHLLAVPSTRPLLGQDDELGARAGGLADEPVGGLRGSGRCPRWS